MWFVCSVLSLFLYHFIHWLCICTAHATLKYTPSFSYPSRSCICWTLTYHIIMPCLSNCLFNTFIDPLLTFCSLRPSNNCLELPVVFFLCSLNIWYAKWFHIPFWKFCVVLSSRIDYKLASIAWCVRITLVDFRWDTMKRDMASEVAKTDGKKTTREHCWALILKSKYQTLPKVIWFSNETNSQKFNAEQMKGAWISVI